MAVDFDANILYYAYHNEDGDDFGVGYLSNKKQWIERVNSWQENDGFETRFAVEDFEELEHDDLRGISLAVVEPMGKEYLITWVVGDDENCLRISEDWDISWHNNAQKLKSIPQWSKRLKNLLKEHKTQ